MKNILDFFTGTASANNFITFGPIHLFILFIALSISVFIYKKNNESRNLELLIGSVLILQQLFLYSWYFITGFHLLTEGLPLFHCRIAIICIGVGLILKKDTLLKIGSYWGIFGSISALLFPGLDPFTFPHITQFSYFIGHLFLLWGAVYLLFVKKVGMSKSDFINILIFTNAYHILMFTINSVIGANYGYINFPPIHIGIGLNHLTYALAVMLLFSIVLFIEYIFINKNTYDEDCGENFIFQKAS